MTNTINGMTPEEIKKGLECCNTFNVCHKCPYEKAVDTEHGWGCVVIRNADALAYIQQLERERDALEEDFARVAKKLDLAFACDFCTHYVPGYGCNPCKFEWRGYQSEPPKEGV